jgi:hypothetical protein
VYLALYNKRLAQPAACTLGVLAAIQSCLIANKLLATLPNDSYQAAGSRGAATSENEAASEASAGRVLVLRTYLPDYVAQAMGIDKLQGYEPVPLSRYMQFMRALTGQRDPISVVFGDSGAEPETMNEALLDLANVRMVYQPRNRAGAVPSAFQWRADNPATVGSLPNENLNQSNEIVFFENMDAMPRAFVTGQTRVLDRSDPVGSLGALRPRDEALMTVEFLPPVARAEFGPAEIVEYSPNRVVVEVDLPAVAYVVLSDMWYPGWTATDNGRRTSVIPANVAFRAVPLSAGKHRVEFTYRPAGLWLGASVSAVAWLAVILAWGYRIVARKRWQADY